MRAKMGRGFTLIELLVVIAIIAILAAILFPVFTSAKEAGRKAACLNNLKQISTAFDLYLSDTNDRYPAAWRPKPPGEANPLYPDEAVTAADAKITWDAAIFRYVKSRGVYRCPSDGLQHRSTDIGGLSSTEPRSYSMNDQLLRTENYKAIVDRYGDDSKAYSGMMRSEPPKLTKYVLMTDWFPRVEASKSANVLGCGDYSAMYCLPDENQQEHNFKKGDNYLFFDGHVRYYDFGYITDKDNMYFVPAILR